MQSLQQELHPKSTFKNDLEIKISELAEKLKLSGKMDLIFIKETLKITSSILSSFSLKFRKIT